MTDEKKQLLKRVNDDIVIGRTTSSSWTQTDQECFITSWTATYGFGPENDHASQSTHRNIDASKESLVRFQRRGK
jgi:hypothetical protein